MERPKWPLPENRLVAGDSGSKRPACKVCGVDVDPFAARCPHCGAPDPLVTWRSYVAAGAMLAGEIIVAVLIFRACRHI